MPERVSPHAGMSDETLEHHLKRYRFAFPYVQGKTVLSVACGNGYGEHLMATEGGAQSVVGFDISEEAITFARDQYMAPNLSYQLSDGKHLDVPTHSQDVVISFETIEHIEEDGAFLRELDRVLKPEGVLLISTPNRAKSLKNYFSKKPTNPYHVREYLKDEFEQLLQSQFASVSLHGQKVIFKRRFNTLLRYAWYSLTGKLAHIEIRDYEVREYPKQKDRETAIFLAVCKH